MGEWSLGLLSQPTDLVEDGIVGDAQITPQQVHQYSLWRHVCWRGDYSRMTPSIYLSPLRWLLEASSNADLVMVPYELINGDVGQ